MNDVRERLRDAATAAAETVRKEDLPTEPAALRVRRRRRMPYLAPLAAAAVVLVVVPTVFAVRLTHNDEPTRPSHVAGGVPGYYVDANRSDRIDVRSVATGKVVSTTGRGVLHGKAHWGDIAAAPDNRHFFLTAGTCGPTVYELVLDDTGRVRSFGTTKIRLPAHTEVRGMDATDGGGKLALAIGTCRGYKTNELLLADPATGAAKTWSLGHIRDGYLDTVSVSGDGSTMLVSIAHADKGEMFELMDTVDGVRHRVRFLAHYGSVRGVPYQAYITADGKSLVVYLGDPEREGARSGPDYGLVRYTLTGKPTRTLAHWHKTNLFSVAFVEGYGTRWLGYAAGDYQTKLYWFAGDGRHPLPQSVANEDVGEAVFAW